MSEYHDAEALLLPDDAEQKINELLEALHASEERMMEGIVAGHDDAPDLALSGDGEPLLDAQPAMGAVASDGSDTADFPAVEEGDFVDLEAEQLGNTSDVLQLDETDPYEELQEYAEPQLLQEQPLPEASSDNKESLSAVEAQQRLDDDALGQLFSAPGPDAVPVTVTAPHRPADTFPSWLSPGLLALLLSVAALWFSLAMPTPATVPQVDSGDRMALEGFKVDLAALRERLNAVEQRAAAGEEAVALLERVQLGLNRVEQQLLTRNPSADASSAPAIEAVAVEASTAATVVSVASQPPAPMDANDSSAEAVAAVPVADDTLEVKTFIKGWAVNLRSYYHQLDAERLMRSYRQAGIAAEIREIRKGVALWYRVRVKGFGSKQEANAFIAGLADKQEREMAWPSYYEGYVKG